VGLAAVDGVGAARAERLSTGGLTRPRDVVEAGPDALVEAGLSAGVAERVVERARDLPAVSVEWGSFPDAVARGDSEMREVTVRNDGGGARVGVRATVNGVEMSRTTTYLSDATAVPVGVFGADDDELAFEVEVTFPDLPLLPERDARTVRVA